QPRSVLFPYTTLFRSGRGEQLVPVLGRHTYHWVLAFSNRGLSTPRVYGELDRLREEGDPPRLGSHQPLLEALASGDPRQLGLLRSEEHTSELQSRENL